MNRSNSSGGNTFYKKESFEDVPLNIKENIIKRGDGKLINEWGEKLGKQYRAISTSRIRKFFGGVERMVDFNENELNLLRPQLAYVVGKEKGEKKDALKHFRNEIDGCIEMVKDAKEFEHLKVF